MRQRVQFYARFTLDGFDVGGREVHLRENHLHVQLTQLVDGLFQLAGAGLDAMRRFHDGRHFQAEFAQQVVVGRMHRGHAQVGVGRLGQFSEGVGTHLPQAFAVGAGVGGVGFGVVRVQLAQLAGNVVDLGNRRADRKKRVRVDHLACATRCNAGGGQQRHVGIGLNGLDVRRFAGGDHAVGKIVVTHAVEHDHVQ
ncbi:hypothetical protein ALP75_204995 [Pseudomonas syringae pv. actinidiae]|nr:hypothetical protein ALP75_204995 [Pseudomonas syringae pv. actinidiae]